MKYKTILLFCILLGFVLGTTTAVVNSSKSKRRYIKLATTSPQAPFSDGILVGNTLYLSGRIGYDPKTLKIPDDLEQEIRTALDGIKATLAEAEMTMDDLVSVQIFCPEPKHYDKFNEVYKTYFKGQLPARAFIGSGQLLREGHFEIQGIAVKD